MKSPLGAIVLVKVLLGLSVHMVSAEPTAAQRYAAATNEVAAEYTLCAARAERAFLRNDDSLRYNANLASCEIRLARSWQRLELKYGTDCASYWDEDDVQDFADSWSATIKDAVDGASTKCSAGMNLEVGRYALGLARAERRRLITGNAKKYSRQRAKCEARLTKRWLRLQKKYGNKCSGDWDWPDVRDFVDSSNATISEAVVGLPAHVVPRLDCIQRNNDGSVTAFFGYESFEAINVEIPVSPLNNGFEGDQVDIG